MVVKKYISLSMVTDATAVMAAQQHSLVYVEIFYSYLKNAANTICKHQGQNISASQKQKTFSFILKKSYQNVSIQLFYL